VTTVQPLHFAMDARLIVAGQHAAEAVKLLQQTVDEEKPADKKLSGFAEGGMARRTPASRTMRMRSRQLSARPRRQAAGRCVPRLVASARRGCGACPTDCCRCSPAPERVRT
jgi:hypothetical protein